MEQDSPDWDYLVFLKNGQIRAFFVEYNYFEFALTKGDFSGSMAPECVISGPRHGVEGRN
jgi:hypothetical protein